MHPALAVLRRHFLGTVFLLLCLLLLQKPAGAVGFARNYGDQLGVGNTQIYATAVDASGNQYVSGYFNNTGLTLGGTTLTRIGSQDVFVAKLDSSGAVLWAKNFGGIGVTAYSFALAVDGSGNPYLGGL